MTPLEELFAARNRLIQFKDTDVTAAFASAATSDMFETLRHTIDAQVAVLDWGIKHAEAFKDGRMFDYSVMDLARAINSTTNRKEP